MILNNRQLEIGFLAVASLVLFCGCGTQPKQYRSFERPSFFESEIRSRTWVDLDGASIHFLSATVTNLGPHGEMMIARFGDAEKKWVRCLEFYGINRKADSLAHDKFVLLDHDWGPRDQYWWPSVVISVEPILRPDSVSFQIVREAFPGTEADGRRLLYFLDYRAGVGFTPNISEWWVQKP